MAYVLNTPAQQQEMLATIGVASISELLEQVPDHLQLQRPLRLPAPLSELELEQEMRQRAAANAAAGSRPCFLGGGAYDHYIPSVVDEITSRGEYYTAYTPYQAEASQGTLQAFFEYQSLVCRLTGLPVSNASLYEGGSAITEACLMAMRQTDRTTRLVIAGTVHPEYLAVLRTYVEPLGCEVVVVPASGCRMDVDAVAKCVDDQTAAVVVQSPNFFGAVEHVAEIFAAARQHGALAVHSFDPISLGLLKRPADLGADIAVAEGQSLGIPLQYGGPFLGMLACKFEYVRKMPGRLIGVTVDRSNRPCFVLNLQAREQHIRRDKATSNICTNQGLMALRATVYLALQGPEGLRETAELCLQKANYAANAIAEKTGCTLWTSGPFFKEFVIRTPGPARDVIAHVASAGVDIGPSLAPLAVPGLDAKLAEHLLLVAVTESRTRAEIDHLVELLAQVAPRS